MRLLLGGLLAVTALATPAAANHLFACEPGFEVICTVNDRVERLVCTKYVTC